VPGRQSREGHPGCRGRQAAAPPSLTLAEKVKVEIDQIGDDLPAPRAYCLQWAVIAPGAQQTAREALDGWRGAVAMGKWLAQRQPIDAGVPH
jgi:hypothetical protein